MSLIHADYYKPRIFAINGDVDDAEIDRAQSIDPTTGLNRVKVEEIGRPGVVGYMKKTSSVGYRLTQLEYGSLEFWQKLVNTTTLGNDGETEIDLDDFKTSYFDICGYMTDDDNTFKGTLWYPALRTSGFSFTIGEPQGIIERSFDFVGEKLRILQGANQYLIYGSKTCGSGDDTDIDLSAKAPAVDPNNAGQYMFRVVRVRAGVTTELIRTTDYTYTDGTSILAIVSVLTDDVIKYWYTSATAPTTQFTVNDSDPNAILGDSASIYLYVPASGKPSTSDYIYKLQSVGIDVRFDREDNFEIGNKDVIARGITNKTVTITLGRILHSATVEEVLGGYAEDYGIIDVDNLSDDVTLIVKIFTDNTKDTLAYGFRCNNLTPTEIRGGVSVNEYVKRDNSLEGEQLLISADVSLLGI